MKKGFYDRIFIPFASDTILYLLATCNGKYNLNQREIALRCDSGTGAYFVRQYVFHTLADLHACIRNPPGRELLCLEYGAIHPGLHIQCQPVRAPKLTETEENVWSAKPREFERAHAALDGNASGWGELVLDVDMDRDRTGFCPCGTQRKVCDLCWKAYMEPMRYALYVAMKRFFGFKRVFCVFSGRRGFHLWICDPRVIRMTHLERGNLIDILVTPKTTGTPDPFTDFMFRALSKYMPDKSREEVFAALWPRIDEPVARDPMRHLHKIPLALHPETNALCVLMGPPSNAAGEFVPSEDTVDGTKCPFDELRDIVGRCAHKIREILNE